VILTPGDQNPCRNGARLAPGAARPATALSLAFVVAGAFSAQAASDTPFGGSTTRCDQVRAGHYVCVSFDPVTGKVMRTETGDLGAGPAPLAGADSTLMDWPPPPGAALPEATPAEQASPPVRPPQSARTLKDGMMPAGHNLPASQVRSR